jgi:sugar phosphate isomerase/epimerase
MSLSRRQLLAVGTALVAVSSTAKGAQMSAARNRKPGLQLYTIRSEMQKDVPGTLKRVAQTGYREVEFAGYFDHKPAEIRKMVADLGMTAPSSHVPIDAIRGKPAQLIADAKQAGHEFLVLAWIPPEERSTAEMWKRHAALLNVFGTQCKVAGLRLAYHNHDFEFAPVGGVLPYDILAQNTDPALVEFELDMYWAKKGGQDLNALFAKHAGRIVMVHVKDMLPNSEMTDVGLGTIPFAQILAAPSAASVEHYFVENDNTKTPFESIATSCKALRKILAGLPA